MLNDAVVAKRLLRAARLRLLMVPKGEIVANRLKKENAQEETSAHGKTPILMTKHGPEAEAQVAEGVQGKIKEKKIPGTRKEPRKGERQ